MDFNTSEIEIFYLGKKKNINLKEYIEKNSVILKNEYLNFCDKLENIKIKNKNLAKYFEVQNNHNLWQMSSIKEKSNLKSKNIYQVIIFLAIKNIISQNKISKIFFYNIPIKQKTLKNFLVNKKISKFNIINNSNENLIKSYFKNFFLIRFLYYLFILLLKIFIELKNNNFKDKDSNFLILAYFGHFKKYKKNKLSFNQFGNLPNVLKNRYLTDIQYIFVPNKNNLTINSLSNSIKKNYSIMNGNLDLVKKLKIFFRFSYYSFKFFFIKRHIYLKLDKISKCIFNILSDDYDNSFNGYQFIDNLIWIEVFESYFSKTSKKKYGIFLLENQPWEKAMITSWKNYSHGEIIAYTPTSINFWHLYNFDNSNKTYSSPSKVFVSSREGFKLLKYQYQKKNIPLKEVESLWFNYLLDIKKKNYNNSKDVILILGDYTPFTNYKIFEIIKNSKLRKIKKIYFKPHPHDLHIYKIKNIRIINKDNKYFFKNSSIVISPGSTAAVIEYLYFGKKVFIYDNPNDLDLSPLKHLNYQFRFKSVEDINNLLKVKFNKQKIIDKFKNYYFLDKNLKKWKNFFYI